MNAFETAKAALREIADAKPHTWEGDVRDQFQPWAQNRARHALALLDAAPEAVKVPEALPVPAPFAGTMGAVHERGYAIGWNACRSAMFAEQSQRPAAEAVSSADYWQKRGHVCKTCGGTGVIRGGSPLHHLGTWADNCPDCAAAPAPETK